jgi:N-sulfoglucosamine sulfohydrolase
MNLRLYLTVIVATAWISTAALSAARPNILIAIADDQSYPHASAYGEPAIKTPAFDRVASQGVLFRNAFTPAPGCSPMRAAFLTGREIWMNREAGTHASFFPRDLPVFTEQLAEAGYHVGMTGKGWGPGRAVDWPHNPAGKSYDARKLKAPKGIRSTDYAANFADFLGDRDDGEPFCFWYGCSEPHRTYQVGIGAENGIDPNKIKLPSFLPESETVRSDIADYMYEIQWFDSHLQRMLDRLEEAGELENTLVIVTSDNGMPFPRAKANLYEYGIHMPLAIAWPAKIPAGQDTGELVSLIDVTRTIFDAAEVTPQQADQMPGHSLLSRFSAASDKTSSPRDAVFSGRERHSSSRFNSLGYPCRCIRTNTHLYIRNFTPERWPAGTPQKLGKAKYDQAGNLVSNSLGQAHGGYHDIDNGPTLQWMIAHRDEPAVADTFAAAIALRPREELYDIVRDPGCMNNLAGQASAEEVRADLARRLTEYLTRTGDLRQTDPVAAHVWETYPRVSSLRWFPVPEWAKEADVQFPKQDWLEERRPR